MTGRDRTSEFVNLVKSITAKPQWINESAELRNRREAALRPSWSNAITGRAQPAVGNSPVDQNYVEFMKMSKTCAHDLSASYGKLEKLTELARKKTIFDDDESSRELNQLVASIKGDIPKLKNQVELLQQKHNPPSSVKSKNIEMHSKNVVKSLQQQLAKMSTNFKSTLEMRSQNLQQQQVRRKIYTFGPSSSYDTPDMVQRGGFRPPAIQPNRTQQQDTPINSNLPNVIQSRPSGYTAPQGGVGMTTNDFTKTRNRKDPSQNLVIDMDSNNQVKPPFGQEKQQIQQQEVQLLNYEDEYMTARANTMQSIETTIVELGTIFNQLATMVQAQDETITRIDTHVSDTAGNVEAAHQALLNYFASMSSNRWLILKVFGILFFFFVIFVIFAG